MRVLMITREFPPYVVGGVGTHTFHLSRALTRLRADVHVVSFGDSEKSSDTVTFVDPKSSIISRSAQSIGQDLAVLYDIARFARISGKIAAERAFDVLHVQEPYVGGYLRADAKVTTIHDTSYGELRSIVGLARPREIEKALFYIGVGFIMEYASMATSNIVITPAPNIRHELVHRYILGGGKTVVVMNGVEPENQYSALSREEAKEMLGLQSSSILIFTSGRHVTRKRLDVFLKALSILEGRNSLKGVEARIGGDGPLRSHLENSARELGLGSRVRFLGWLTRDALELHYRASDIFVACSDYEASPIAILEAMIAGAPVVSTNIPGFPAPALARDRVDILLTAPGDPVSLADAVELLIEDDNLRGAISTNERAFALRYSWEEVAKRTMKIYGAALGSRNTSSPSLSES
jgi:glycosyltransferase involved in cell wall biosynthesis